MIVTVAAYSGLGMRLCAQTPDSQTALELPKRWQSTTDLKSDDLMPQRIPVRIVESHSQNGDRTMDKRSVEIRGTDRHFEPYQDIEKETLVVDPSTVRTTTRTFGRDVNGKKALLQVTEEEKHVLSGGDSSLVRETYNPDVNGKLEPVQRDEVRRRTNGKDLEETDVKVMLHSVDGGLAAAFKTHELRKRTGDDTVEAEKTTWLPDINGKWQVSEIRQNISTQEAQDRRVEEKVFRPNAEGKLAQISRVVSRESQSTDGETRNSVENYSIDVPGTTRDGNLHLVERRIATAHSGSTGERTSEEKVEQINPGDPDSGLRVSVLVNGKMVPGQSGEASTVTIRVRDSNNNFGVVSVDTTKSDRAPTIQIQQTTSEKP
jgi:hypothetical protein